MQIKSCNGCSLTQPALHPRASVEPLRSSFLPGRDPGPARARCGRQVAAVTVALFVWDVTAVSLGLGLKVGRSRRNGRTVRVTGRDLVKYRNAVMTRRRDRQQALASTVLDEPKLTTRAPPIDELSSW